MNTAGQPARTSPPGVLLVRDVARIWTEEARRKRPDRPPIQPSTVWSYVKESFAENGRYRDNPVPRPYREGQRAWWAADQEPALRQWWHSRPGHGPGRPRSRSGGDRAGAG